MQVNRPKKYGILLVLFLQVFYAHAEWQDTIDIEEIEIRGNIGLKHTAHIENIMDSAVLHAKTNASLSDVLSDHTPLFIKSYGPGNMSTVSVRGAAASHTQVLWDGFNINSPMTGQADLSLVPSFFIDNVKLQYGGASLSNTSGALGGAVQLDNNPSWRKGFHADVIQQVGSFGSFGTFAKMNVGFKDIEIKIRAYSHHSENDFTYLNTADIPYQYDKQENAAFNEQGALGEVYWKADEKNVLEAKMWFQENDRELPRLISDEGMQIDEHQAGQTVKSRLGWSHYFNSDIYFKLNTGIMQNNLNYSREATSNGLINNDSRSYELNWVNDAYFKWNAGPGTVVENKLQYNRYKVGVFDHAPVVMNGYDKVRHEMSVFASVKQELFSRLKGLISLRQQHVDGSFIPLIPAVGMEYELWPKHQIAILGNVTRNYHVPSLNDLYWVPNGNPDLRSEKGWVSDLAIDHEWSAGSWKGKNQLKGFYSNISDWIIWRPQMNARFWTPENIKTVLSRGAEYQGSLHFKYRNWRFKSHVNYAFTRTTNGDIPDSDTERDGQLSYIPKHKFSFMFNAGYNNWTVGITSQTSSQRYASPSYLESSTNMVLNPYQLTTLSLGKKWLFKKYEFITSLKVNNLLDHHYQMVLYHPMPGRYYNFSVKLSL